MQPGKDVSSRLIGSACVIATRRVAPIENAAKAEITHHRLRRLRQVTFEVLVSRTQAFQPHTLQSSLPRDLPRDLHSKRRSVPIRSPSMLSLAGRTSAYPLSSKLSSPECQSLARNLSREAMHVIPPQIIALAADELAKTHRRNPRPQSPQANAHRVGLLNRSPPNQATSGPALRCSSSRTPDR